MQNCNCNSGPNCCNPVAVPCRGSSSGLRAIRYPSGNIAIWDGDETLELSAEQARVLAHILTKDTAHKLAQALAEFTATSVLVQAQFASEDAEPVPA